MISMVKWIIIKSRWWWRVMVVVETTATPVNRKGRHRIHVVMVLLRGRGEFIFEMRRWWRLIAAVRGQWRKRFRAE